MFLLWNVWLVLLKTGFMLLRTKKKRREKEPNLFLTSCSPMFLLFQKKNQFLNRFHVFVKECLVSVIENMFHVLKNKKKKKKNQTCSCSPMFLFFHNKNQFLNRFYAFVKKCLVSVIENKFHVFNKNMFSFQLFLL